MIYALTVPLGVALNQLISIRSPGATGIGGSESATSVASMTVIRLPFFRSSAVQPLGAFGCSIDTCFSSQGRFFVGVNLIEPEPPAETLAEYWSSATLVRPHFFYDRNYRRLPRNIVSPNLFSMGHFKRGIFHDKRTGTPPGYLSLRGTIEKPVCL